MAKGHDTKSSTKEQPTVPASKLEEKTKQCEKLAGEIKDIKHNHALTMATQESDYEHKVKLLESKIKCLEGQLQVTEHSNDKYVEQMVAKGELLSTLESKCTELTQKLIAADDKIFTLHSQSRCVEWPILRPDPKSHSEQTERSSGTATQVQTTRGRTVNPGSMERAPVSRDNTTQHQQQDRDTAQDGANTGRPNRTEGQLPSQAPEKKRVLLMGNSQLRDIDANRLSRDWETDKLMSYTIKDATHDIAQQQGDYDLIIYHLLQNDIKTEPAEQCVKQLHELVDTTKSVHSNSDIVISMATARHDNSDFHAKAMLLNALVMSEFSNTEKVHLAFNDNFSQRGQATRRLFTDGIHLSDQGVKVLASNLKDVVCTQLNISRNARARSQSPQHRRTRSRPQAQYGRRHGYRK